jgi:TonB family protein
MSPANPHFPARTPAAAHLPAAVLRQYAAGTLTAAERRQVERHTLDCALCADALEGYQQAAPAATSPAALAELQQRLHARVAAEPARTPRVGAWWMAAAAAVLLLAFVGLWQWQRPTTTARAPRATAARERQQERAPAVVSAPAPAVDAAPPAAPVTPPVAAPAQPEPAPAYAAAPVRPLRRARPAVAATRAPVAATDVQGLGEVRSASAEAELAAPVATAPAPAAEQAAEEAKAKIDSQAVLAGRTAGVAVMSKAAPAAQPPLREESGKRKSELPPAPALAPFPNGGYPAFRNYLIREQKRPEGVPRTDGVVKLKFTVEADGSVQNIQVVRGLSPELDAEAMRLLCEGPSWRPGIVGGRRASQTITIDVPFR